jgi:hypothetical protein
MNDDDFAALLDLQRHLNNETGEVGDVISAALLNELGPESQEDALELAMAAVARLVEHFDGRRVHISSIKRAKDAIRKDKARRLFAEGASRRQVTARTGLSPYQARQVRAEMEADCDGGPLAEARAEA